MQTRGVWKQWKQLIPFALIVKLWQVRHTSWELTGFLNLKINIFFSDFLDLSDFHWRTTTLTHLHTFFILFILRLSLKKILVLQLVVHSALTFGTEKQTKPSAVLRHHPLLVAFILKKRDCFSSDYNFIILELLAPLLSSADS